MLILNLDDSCGAWNLIATVLLVLLLEDRFLGSKSGKSNSKHPSMKLTGLVGGLHGVSPIVVGNRIDPSSDVLDILSLVEKSWMGVAPPLMLAMRDVDGLVLLEDGLSRRFFLMDGPDIMDGCEDVVGMNDDSLSIS